MQGLVRSELDRDRIFEGPYLNDPIVNQAMTYHLRGDLTWEESLILAVLVLSDRVKQLNDKVVDIISNGSY